MKDLVIATIGLWHLWPLAVAIGIGLGIGKGLELAGARDRLPTRMQRTYERVHVLPRLRDRV
jgi:hypothetical protein